MPVLLLLVGLATAVWLASDSPGTGFMVLGAIFLPLIIYWLSRNLNYAVVGMIAAAAVPRFSFEVSGLNAKPEHLVAGILLVVLIIRRKYLYQEFKWTLPDYLVLTYLALNILSSRFMSIAPGQTVKWSLQQALAILPYFLLRAMVNTTQKFERAVQALLVIGAAVASFGVLCYFSHLLFHTSFGVEVNQYGEIPATYGTLYEANLLGSFCGAVFMLMLVFYSQKPTRNLLFGLLVTAGGMVVSFSRGALGATLVASVVFFFLGRRIGLLRKAVMKKLAVSMATLCLVLAITLFPSYMQRLSSFTPEGLASDNEAQSRIIAIAFAFENIVKHPILGNGTSSFQLFFTYGEAGLGEQEAGFWIGNAEIRMAHDTGLVGLIVFMAFIGALVKRSIRRLRQHFNLELLALFLSGLVYCIAFQATEGTLLAFPWIHFGLIACALSLNSESAGLPAAAPVVVPEGSGGMS